MEIEVVPQNYVLPEDMPCKKHDPEALHRGDDFASMFAPVCDFHGVGNKCDIPPQTWTIEDICKAEVEWVRLTDGKENPQVLNYWCLTYKVGHDELTPAQARELWVTCKKCYASRHDGREYLPAAWPDAKQKAEPDGIPQKGWIEKAGMVVKVVSRSESPSASPSEALQVIADETARMTFRRTDPNIIK